MNKENFYTDNDDLLFHVEKRMNIDEFFDWLPDEEKELHSAESSADYMATWKDMMASYGEYCGSVVAPNAEKVEKQDIKLVDGEVQIGQAMQENIDGFIEMGVPAFAVGTKYDGLGAPFFVEMASCEILNRACPSTLLNTGWWGPIAHILEEFASEDLKQEYVPRIATGEMSGNMALTEAGAGSDLSAIETYGEKQEDGTWILNGTKLFISNGNSEISLVLAKNKKGAKGLRDLSLYLCPRDIDGKRNIRTTKLEEKIGLHGSATAEIVYENSKAFLLGEDGEGFKYMLRLMNDSRIAVSFQGLGLMEACLRLAKQYASERKTWGKPIEQHELIAEKLLDLEVETKGYRSLCYQAAFERDVMVAGEQYLKDHPDLGEDELARVRKRVKKARYKVRQWTPLIKYIAGEQSYDHARTCLQIHGGAGFTKEYKAEWWVRESLIYSIYEGTSQIQALMCMKDTLKEMVSKPVEYFEAAFGIRMRMFSQQNPIERNLSRMQEEFHKAVIAVVFKLVKTNVKSTFSDVSGADVVRVIKTLGKELVKFEELGPALLHAERICEMKCLVAVCEAAVADMAVDPDRAYIAERLVNKGLLRVNYLRAGIDLDDPVIEKLLESYSS